MKSLFAKKAANTNEPKPEQHFYSDEKIISNVPLAGMLGEDNDGEPLAEIFEMNFDEPRLVSLQADRQSFGAHDLFRMYLNFDDPETEKKGERAVLVAHNMTKDQVDHAFDALNALEDKPELEMEESLAEDEAGFEYFDFMAYTPFAQDY